MKTLLTLLLTWGFLLAEVIAAPVDEYVAVIREQGQDPIKFIQSALKSRDLLIFDDAIHSAQEPFDFYQQLLQDPEIQKSVRYIFIEVFSTADQPRLDAYFNASTRDNNLLSKVFQDDYGGYGWKYQTYLDLLSTIWEINSKLPPEARLQVIGVSQPVYWEAIHTRQDYDLFQDSLSARDYYIYRTIREKMEHFKSGKKGVFLTNTRHAYKHLKNAEGKLHWNTATFFNEWDPGKTLSVRFHNVVLSIQPATKKAEQRTAQGLEEFDYKWVRLDNGAWDDAFSKAGNRPVAISLNGNTFGLTPYVGNLMLDASPGQTMADVYDAIIFLKPLEELHLSAQFNFIFTPEFKTELKRRILLMEGSHLDAFLKENGCKDIDELIALIAVGEPQKKSPYTG